MPSFAQVTFVAPTKSVIKGDVFSAEIRVKTKDTISALQFTLEWDPSVLEFRSTDGVTLPVGSDELFGLTSVAQGNLKFLWLSSSAEGIKIADNAIIFKVNFKAIGNIDNKSDLKFTNKVVRVKALNPKVESLPVIINDGLITITTTSALYDTGNNQGGAILYDNKPNPFEGVTYINFEIKEPELVSIEVYDSIGRQIFQKKQNFMTGKHSIALNTEGELLKGVYIYGIRIQNQFLSKKMIKL